ncbi:hypothetical protein DFA_01375 [Cavenderia fasciculata]|uniref:Uncharacterized protein n=1 Tax=Cavenderia fasciculata TaxID=261658 RepID=F4PSF9_CACFS|nr:uncharacterized protein DFA_01375 [Cavenderia fasciculata]EGG21489.1 hypothetical protein DFA_01375 [Cavenderia fasciculata]|eukprot:XP_004359339.1 hypothetical protein DFA_01375 [Cavenderia fasciculata]
MREDQFNLNTSNEGFNFKSTLCNGICLKTFSNQNGTSDIILEDQVNGNNNNNNNNDSLGREMICQFLKDNENYIKGQCVLELGSCEGLCGLFAAKLGCIVVMTESRDNIPTLNENIRLNDCSLTSCAVRLNWGIQSIPELINTVPIPFDFIMASDIIIPSGIENALQLFSLVSTILKIQKRSNKDCYFLLSYIQRDHLTTSKTLDIADRFGLKYELVPYHHHHHTDGAGVGKLWKFDLKV